MSLRLDHATVVDPSPQGPRVLEEASVYVEDGLIVEVGASRPEAEEVISCSGCIVAPGLVNAHTHAAMVLFRGAGDELPLERWLRDRIWPAEARLSAEDVLAGTELAIAEMLAGGTTAFADMYLFNDQVAQAAERSGIRCVAGFTLADAGTPEFGPGDLLAEAEAFLKRYPADGSRVQGSIAPHATYTCSGELLQAAADLAAQGGHLLQTHCAETRSEVYSVERTTGRRPVAQLDAHGCLGERSALAHCGWITKEEVRQIAASGARAVHNPVANMKLATGGTMPLPELLEAGVPVGLGTDGAASNNRLDMFETMKATALVHKHHRWQADLLPAGQVLGLATRGGAQVLGMQDGGRVVAGAPADLMVVDTRVPHLQPLHDPVSQLVYAARAGDVRTTIVEGKTLYHQGSFHTLELEEVLERAGAAAERVLHGTGQGAG